MAIDLQDDPTKTVEPATTGDASSTSEQAGTAKKADIADNGDGQGDKPKTSQDAASPDDSDDDETPKPDKDNLIQVRLEQFERLKRQKNEARDELNALDELGISSREHAAALRSDADNYHYILEQLENRPQEFFVDLYKTFPKAYEGYMLSGIDRFLDAWIDSYKKQGDDDGAARAIVLADIRKMLNGKSTKQEVQPKDTERAEVQKEKWELFTEEVVSKRDTALAAKITELLPKGIEFKSQRQKEKFFDEVIEDVLDTLERDTTFVRERDRAQNPARGLGKAQRQETADVYLRFASTKDSSRIKSAIARQTEVMNLPVSSSGNGKPERREASVQGMPARVGGVSQEESDKKYNELRAKGLSGKRLTQTWLDWKTSKMLGRT